MSLDITSASALAEQTERTNDDANKKLIALAHRNLSRKNCLLAENISEIHYNILELTTRPDSFSDEEACGKSGAPAESEGGGDDIVARYELEENAGDPCKIGSGNDVAPGDAGHKSVKDAVPLPCKVSLKDNDPTAMYRSRVTSILLKMSSDNEDDDDDENEDDANLLTDGLALLAPHAFKDPSNSQSALPTTRYCDATDDATVSSSAPNNNNKSRNALEDAVDGSETTVLPEHVRKETPRSRDAASTSSHYSDSAASTSKPFKLPILEKMHKTANLQPVEIEENAVALLDSSFSRQDQLEEVRCLDLEPRSSNSSEESNSDMESQHASVSRSDAKKVSEYASGLPFLSRTFNCGNAISV